METVADRLKELRIKAGYKTAADFARAHQITVVTYRAQENGTNGVPRDSAIEYARMFGTSVEWLLTGKGEAPDPIPAPQPSILDEFALLPVYDARAAAGFGCVNDEAPDPIHMNAYRLDWLRRVTSAPADQLAVIRVAGDSNWPTLHDGDHVLIDRTVNRYSRDGLYVIRHNHEDETMVKRLSRDPRSRTLTVKSDNPDYPTFDGVKDDDLAVIGRVLWLGRNVG
jgi:SOS-response transcriptional repressor LexA